MSSEANLEVEETKNGSHSASDSGFNDADENDNTTTCTSVKLPELGKGEGSRGDGTKKVEKLEAPSEELRCIQKQVLIEKMMTGKASPKKKMVEETEEKMETEESEECKRQEPKRKKRDPKGTMPPPRKTFKLQSSVLDRVKSFLPQLKTANDTLIRLPDPSKLSLESDSDLDEVDGNSSPAPVPGPSSSTSKENNENHKTFVEMNLALYAESGSDTSSEEEDDSLPQRKIKGLPEISSKKVKQSSPSSKPLIEETKNQESPNSLPENLNSSQPVSKCTIRISENANASKSQEGGNEVPGPTESTLTGKVEV